MLSSACQDTIRAVVWLSTQKKGELHRIQEISDRLGLPFHFLAKSLQKLVTVGLLRSQRGPSGGICLAHEASQITLLSIIYAVDGSHYFDRCVLGMGDCEAETPCALHAQWDIWRQEMLDMYGVMKLSEITEDILRRKVKRI